MNNSTNTKIDILLVDFLTLSGFDIADEFNIKSIVSYPNIQPFQYSGIRIPTSYTGHGIQMKWFDKLINDLVYRIKPIFLYPGSREINNLRYQRNLSNFEFGFDEYYYNRLILCYNSFSFDYPQLIHPLIEYTGPLQVSFQSSVTKQKLNIEKSLFSWLNDLENKNQKVIYVSTGTTGIINNEVIRLFYSSFDDFLKSNPNYYILWHLSNEFLSILPYIMNDHIKIVESLNQPDVLKHNAIKAFFSHCGINSVYESIIAGKPIIALPFRYDQKDNAARIEDHNIGYRLDKFLPNLKSNHIVDGIIHVLNDQQYEINMKQLQKIILHEGGAVKAVDLIEKTHAIGYNHLIPKNLFTPWWYIDQEISAYILYACLLYSQFCLIRGIINAIKKKRNKQKED